MQLQLEKNAGLNHITSYGTGFFMVNEQRVAGSVIVSPEGPVREWAARSVDSLPESTISEIIERRPELVILGSGRTHRFPAAALMAQFAAAGIGLEVMNSGAACRTYNLLAGEGRNVSAMLISISDED